MSEISMRNRRKHIAGLANANRAELRMMARNLRVAVISRHDRSMPCILRELFIPRRYLRVLHIWVEIFTLRWRRILSLINRLIRKRLRRSELGIDEGTVRCWHLLIYALILCVSLSVGESRLNLSVWMKRGIYLRGLRKVRCGRRRVMKVVKW